MRSLKARQWVLLHHALEAGASWDDVDAAVQTVPGGAYGQYHQAIERERVAGTPGFDNPRAKAAGGAD